MMIVMEKKPQSQQPKLLERIAKAIARLRKLGAREIEIRNGVKGLYIPGNVNVRNIMDVKTYGMYVAANKRTHKHYLRHNKK